MAKIVFNIEPGTAFNTQVREGTALHASKKLLSRATAQYSSIVGDVRQLLIATFNKTEVARALRGQGGDDLPAHLGLTDSQAVGLADGMAELIGQSVRFTSSISNNRAGIRVQAVQSSWEEYLQLPGAEYVSEPSKIVIPVVRWLLIDPSIDIGQAAYDLVFKGENKKFDVQIQKVSRSGRAIMVSLKALGGGGGYVLPSIISGTAGENFIEMTLGQPGVAAAVAQILMKRVG